MPVDALLLSPLRMQRAPVRRRCCRVSRESLALLRAAARAAQHRHMCGGATAIFHSAATCFAFIIPHFGLSPTTPYRI